MELEKIEKQASNIRKYSELVINQYRGITNSLNVIYNIVVKMDSLIAGKIKKLIDRYNLMIKEVSDNYVDSANRILEYVEQTRRNLEQLALDIRKSTIAFEESIVKSNINKSP